MTDEPEEGQELAPEPPAKPKTTAAEQTGYMVLAQVTKDSGVTWNVVGTNLTARSAELAVRIYAEKLPADRAEIVLVAVPARSWRPVKVTAKVTTSLVIEEAS